MEHLLPAAEAVETAHFSAIAEDLEVRGYSVRPHILPHDVLSFLAAEVDALSESDFSEATVGRDNTYNQFVRRNRIHWIQENDRQNPWLDWTESLRCYLNQQLFLGLFSFESHFTRYENGDFYRRHLDAFKGERNRVLSLVTYLNEGWLPDQGGELRLFHDDGSQTLVTPEAGTVVLFLSEEVPHEVLPTHRTRYGLAGWYRLNAGLGEKLDPPQ